MSQVDTDLAVDGDTPPVDVIIHLLRDHPDQWRIRMPEAQHLPSSLSIMFRMSSHPLSTATIATVGGTQGIKLSRRDTKAIEKLVLRVMAWQALAFSREAVLEGRNYMKPDPERMKPYTANEMAAAAHIKPIPHMFSDAMLQQYKREFMLTQDEMFKKQRQVYGIIQNNPLK